MEETVFLIHGSHVFRGRVVCFKVWEKMAIAVRFTGDRPTPSLLFDLLLFFDQARSSRSVPDLPGINHLVRLHVVYLSCTIY